VEDDAAGVAALLQELRVEEVQAGRRLTPGNGVVVLECAAEGAAEADDDEEDDDPCRDDRPRAPRSAASELVQEGVHGAVTSRSWAPVAARHWARGWRMAVRGATYHLRPVV
jgi:hypothetical protein